LPAFKLVTSPEQITDSGYSYIILPPFDPGAIQRKIVGGHKVICINYHWNDRNKLRRDYKSLASYYDNLLEKLVPALNDYHNVRRSVRYWRIILGPWLYRITGLLLDRWEMTIKGIKEYQIETAIVSDHEFTKFVPENIDAANFYYGQDFNDFIYSEIFLSLIPKVIVQHHLRETTDNYLVSLKTTISKPEKGRPRFIPFVGRSLQRLFSQNHAYFLYSTGINTRQLISLSFMLSQFPLIWDSRPTYFPKIRVPNENRLQIIQKTKDSDFETFAAQLIGKIIPVRYLEGFKDACDFCSRLPWPDKPVKIFTTSGWADEVFKFWAASKIEEGTNLLVGQHGGVIGLDELQISEDHQIEISDKFLSWGWSDGRSKVIPAVGLTRLLTKNRYLSASNGGIILVMTVIPTTTVKVQSMPLGSGQSEKYFKDQCQFIEKLEPKIQGKLTVRLDRELEVLVDTDYTQILKERFPALVIDSSTIDIATQVKRNRLFVGSYRATGYLETLAHNVPTIIYWDPNLWEVRDSAQPYFDLLQRAGIYHYSPQSAATHININWNNISVWWNTKLVQEARNIFCQKYARREKHYLHLLRREIID
jgi:putative transferase (TIGR04331 family)